MNKRGAVKLAGVGKSFGQTSVLQGVDLEIRPGEFFSLLGPSGSGKTTTLRIIAGLETATRGHVYLGDVDATLTPPGDRDVAMVFQSYALYPHMSVFDNIAFPLKMIRMPAAAIAVAVQEAAARVRIDHLLLRRPGQLSGGQQQRCALARAIVRKPALFLLDEPLSNLDAKLRVETRVELRRLQRALDVTTVYVTHDQEEAMSMSDRLAVFMDGRIVQIGTPDEILRNPSDAYVRAFFKGVDVKKYLLARDLVRSDVVPVVNTVADSHADLSGAVAQLRSARCDHAFVVDEAGRLQGTVSIDSLLRALEAGAPSMRSALLPDAAPVDGKSSVQALLGRCVKNTLPVAVVDDAGRYLGAVTQTILLQRFAAQEEAVG